MLRLRVGLGFENIIKLVVEVKRFGSRWPAERHKNFGTLFLSILDLAVLHQAKAFKQNCDYRIKEIYILEPF